MSLTEEERLAIVLYRIEKAQKALEEIHKVLPLEVWSIIANRMYYALYYAASALLISDAHQVSTHKGVISLLNQYYVRTGLLSKEDGNLFGFIFAFRKGCDYDDFIDASEVDVNRYLPQVEQLVEKIITLINNKKQNI